ncbi:hypothetical protein L218DRAFT_948780 [Marasmius fiardii PR-910]|nr:hypothetical protein L218DRAFT_948780 [Marasmius fiardii PR-910]
MAVCQNTWCFVEQVNIGTLRDVVRAETGWQPTSSESEQKIKKSTHQLDQKGMWILVIEASHSIGKKTVQTPSLWKMYLGLDPEFIMPEIICWYEKAEELKRKILNARERDKGSHLEAEEYCHQIMTRAPSQAQVFMSAYESPSFPAQTDVIVIDIN